MSSSSAQTLGLVGCGIWGRNILRDLKALGHVVWVAESSPEGRTAAAGLADGGSGSPGRSSAGRRSHCGYTRLDARAGVSAGLHGESPILCEKPLTAKVAEARALVARAGEKLFTGHIWCYHPGIETLASIARSGELGPVHGLRSTRTNWASPRRDVDSVWNLAPHDVALAQFILGEIPAPRFAHAELIDGRCVGMIGILGADPWAIFEVSNRFREKRREVRLHCRDGVAVLPDADAGRIEITRKGAGLDPSRRCAKSAATRRSRASWRRFARISRAARRPEQPGRRDWRSWRRSRSCAGWRD